MDEKEGLGGSDSRAMVQYIAGRATMRKAQLFAAACCRRVWDDLSDPRSRDAVEVVERLADGLAGKEDWQKVEEGAYDACEAVSKSEPGGVQSRADYFAALAMCWAVRSLPDNVMGAAWHASTAVGRRALAAAGKARGLRAVRLAAEAEEFAAQCHLLRDIMGNPFRPLQPIPLAVLAWDGGVAVKLAARIYEERDFSRESMGVLADAVEEAGCQDADILGHLRSPGPHVRGCWAVDLLLGKE
jgi:hypothetical protein